MVESKKKNSADTYFALGIAVLVLYALFLIPNVVGSALGEGPLEKIKELNHLGDFLSGVFAPVAFIFFVISVLIQREEFRLARDEMSDTRGELRKQVAQMKFSGMAIVFRDDILRVGNLFSDEEKRAVEYFFYEYTACLGGNFFQKYNDNLITELDKNIVQIKNLDHGMFPAMRQHYVKEFNLFFEKIRKYKIFLKNIIDCEKKISSYIVSFKFLNQLYIDVDESGGAAEAFSFSEMSSFFEKLNCAFAEIANIKKFIESKSMEEDCLKKISLIFKEKGYDQTNVNI